MIEEYHRGIKQFCGVEMLSSKKKSVPESTHNVLPERAFLRFEVERLRTGISWFESKRRIFRGAIREYIKIVMKMLMKKKRSKPKARARATPALCFAFFCI